jgi:hypothetical protein
MTPTDDLREELRELIAEVIPAGGTDADTRFMTTQIDRLLTRAANINAAAAQGWTLKANMLMGENDGLQGYSVGQEKYTFTELDDALEFCQNRAAHYSKLAGAGSMIIAVTPPSII